MLASLLMIASRRRCVNVLNVRRARRALRPFLLRGALVVWVQGGDGARAIGDVERVAVNRLMLFRPISAQVGKECTRHEANGADPPNCGKEDETHCGEENGVHFFSLPLS